MMQDSGYEAFEKRIKELEREARECALAKAALEESEEKFRALTASATDAIITMDDQGAICYWNEAAEQIFGHPARDVLGTELHLLLAPPQYHETYRKGLAEFRKTGLGTAVGKTMELVAVRKDGSTFPIELSVSAAKIEGRWHATGIVRDITERREAENALRNARDELEQRVAKRTEELTRINEQLKREIAERNRVQDALRESEERYRRIIGAVTDYIFTVRIQDGRPVETIHGATCVAVTGYSAEEYAGNPYLWILMVYEEDRPAVEEQARLVLQGRDPYPIEHRIIRKDGAMRWVRNTLVPHYHQDGRLLAYDGVLSDITKRKEAEDAKVRLEAQLLQAQKMEAIGTLAGGIAHDFNNLLMGIQGNVSLMLLDTNPDSPHCERLKRIQDQIKSGAKLTSQLLGYARKGRYVVESIDLNHLVRETSETFARTRKQISIHKDFAENLFMVEVDQGQIEQVLMNLFVNAADAMPAGGILSLQTRNVTHGDIQGKLYNPKPGNYVQLNVADTGTGIDQEIQGRIFEPFFTTKEMGRGTGLGLASAYGIIKGHGGYIEMESEKGRGTTFRIFLPATTRKVETSAAELDLIVAGAEETILLVDDEDLIREVGKELLDEMGYHVLTAKDGREAIQVYSEHQEEIDLVLLDIVMPNMGGSETFDRLRAINPEIRVLLSSGFSIDSEAGRILRRGCNGFIQKPYRADELSKKIQEVIRTR